MKKEIILVEMKISLVGKSIDETIKHCKEVHKYDLIELLELNGIDPKNTRRAISKSSGKI